MKIVYITPGTGGTFYCQNCLRDNELLNSLYALGHDVRKVPMYLPLSLTKEKSSVETPVFYGAVNEFVAKFLVGETGRVVFRKYSAGEIQRTEMAA